MDMESRECLAGFTTTIPDVLTLNVPEENRTYSNLSGDSSWA